MLKALQIFFLFLLAVAIAAFSTWRYFYGDAWWLAALGGLIGYAALLSGVFLKSREAWHGRAIRIAFDFALSSELRATLSLVLLLGATVLLCTLAYRARPPDTDYFEVRVYDQVDLPGHYHVGANVILHTRTDGLTHQETVSGDGGAVFRSVPIPTTLYYQVEVLSAIPPFLTGGNHKVDRLPDQLGIDTAAIPTGKRQTLSPVTTELALKSIPRPAEYLVNVEERGDWTLQGGNAPWGVPRADLILNRLGYVLGYDLERRLPRWVAYSVGPTERIVPRTQKFIADPAIAIDRQARVRDYSQSGYDRGHMISPADLFFKGPVTVAEAFYMSTVTPQRPWLNRGLWKVLERRVRTVVKSRQQLAFVIAGPLFIAPPGTRNFEFQTIGGTERIPVPTHFFRIMVMTTANGVVDAFAVIAPNASDGVLELEHYLVSIREIEIKSGLTFFPLLNPQIAEKLKTEVGKIW